MTSMQTSAVEVRIGLEEAKTFTQKVFLQHTLGELYGSKDDVFSSYRGLRTIQKWANATISESYKLSDVSNSCRPD
jgi:hypothetical protein